MTDAERYSFRVTHHTSDTPVALPDASEDYVALIVPPVLRPHLWRWLDEQRGLLVGQVPDVPELDGFPAFIVSPKDERFA